MVAGGTGQQSHTDAQLAGIAAEHGTTVCSNDGLLDGAARHALELTGLTCTTRPRHR
jgi:hypothetical protein